MPCILLPWLCRENGLLTDEIIGSNSKDIRNMIHEVGNTSFMTIATCLPAEDLIRRRS